MGECIDYEMMYYIQLLLVDSVLQFFVIAFLSEN